MSLKYTPITFHAHSMHKCWFFFFLLNEVCWNMQNMLNWGTQHICTYNIIHKLAHKHTYERKCRISDEFISVTATGNLWIVMNWCLYARMYVYSHLIIMYVCTFNVHLVRTCYFSLFILLLSVCALRWAPQSHLLTSFKFHTLTCKCNAIEFERKINRNWMKYVYKWNEHVKHSHEYSFFLLLLSLLSSLLLPLRWTYLCLLSLFFFWRLGCLYVFGI